MIDSDILIYCDLQQAIFIFLPFNVNQTEMTQHLRSQHLRTKNIRVLVA